LYRFIKREGFQIVHTHTSKAGILGRLAARLAGTAVIIHTVHGFHFDEHMSRPAQWAFVALERLAGGVSDLIFSQSAEDVRTAIQYGVCPKGRIVHLGNGVNLETFNPRRVDEEERRIIRRECRAKGPLVLMIAELIPRKGCFDFLSAAYKVTKVVPGTKFVLVGEGPLRSDLEKVIRRLGLEGDFLLPGFREDIPELLAAADLYVLSSYREGMPRSIIEAMAMAKPVVATNIRGSREIVQDDETGILVPVKDSKALAGGILELLQDKEKARYMGLAGRQRAERLFDERRMFEVLKREYERLMMEKGLSGIPER